MTTSTIFMQEANQSKKHFIVSINLLLWSLFFTLLFTTATVFAAPVIKKMEYEGKGIVEADFVKHVQYKNLKITVKDTSGNSYKTDLLKKDSDDLKFQIKGYRYGREYLCKISGIRNKKEPAYTSVSAKVYIPKAIHGIPIKEVSYDRKEREVSIEFDTFVQWKQPSVSITDGKKNYTVKISDLDKDEIEIKVKSLKRGKKYTYQIRGIRKKGNSSYKTISGTFTA